MKPVDSSLAILAKSMNLRLQKHAAIAGNIANADTPGFRPTDVSFEKELQRAVSSGSTAKLDHVSARIQLADDDMPRPDGNSVNLDKQMVSMSENTLMYNATAEFLGKKLKMLKSVIG